jgi:hypothetical protein
VAQAAVKLSGARMKQWMICSDCFKKDGQMKKMAPHFTAEAGTDVTNNFHNWISFRPCFVAHSLTVSRLTVHTLPINIIF